MTNGTNAVNGNQMESLATSLKSYITSSVSNLNTVVGTQSVLGSTATTFDGSLWLSASTPPVLKLYYGGNTYSFATEEINNVLDYRSATSGQNITVGTAGMSVYGSAYADTIRVKATDCTIVCGAGNDSMYIDDSTAARTLVSLTSGNNKVLSYSTGTTTIYGGTGNDSLNVIYSHFINLAAGGNNTVSFYRAYNSTVVCGNGSDRINVDQTTPVIRGFSNNDTIFLNENRSDTGSYSWTSSVSGSNVNILRGGSTSSIVALQDCTASQFHILHYTLSDGQRTLNKEVYTISGSQLVKV